MARALDTDDVPGAVYDLARAMGAPASLAAIGMPEDGIAEAARQIAAARPRNPRPVTEDAMLAVLRDAWAGRRPSAMPVTAA
jgi:maleylacetate reductase